jgi:hypothetical protein
VPPVPLVPPLPPLPPIPVVVVVMVPVVVSAGWHVRLSSQLSAVEKQPIADEAAAPAIETRERATQ